MPPYRCGVPPVPRPTLTRRPLRQPREHLFGHGCSAAEWHEQSGPANAVHVSSAVMAALDRADAAAAAVPDPATPSSSSGVGEAGGAPGQGMPRSSSAWSISTSDAAEPIGSDDDEGTGAGGDQEPPALPLSPGPAARGDAVEAVVSSMQRSRSFVLLPDGLASDDD